MNQMTERKKAVRTAAKHLGIDSRNMKQLTNVIGALSDETFAIMLELLSQPDPHGHVVEDICKRYWFGNKDAAGFSEWLECALICYHAVDDIITPVFSYHDDSAIKVVDGVHHYREQNAAFSSEQTKDFARITAAAFTMMIENPDISPDETLDIETITESQFHTYRLCIYLQSGIIMDLAAGNHDTADEIVRIILEHRVYSEPRIMHLLQGGTPSLVEGAL